MECLLCLLCLVCVFGAKAQGQMYKSLQAACLDPLELKQTFLMFLSNLFHFNVIVVRLCDLLAPAACHSQYTAGHSPARAKFLANTDVAGLDISQTDPNILSQVLISQQVDLPQA